jgi:hypothetical protein
MSQSRHFKIRDEYAVASCCDPVPDEPVIGYHSHDDIIKLHRASCSNLENVDPDRLIALEWSDILVVDEFEPDDLYTSLEENDLRILELHLRVGIDYSHKVARILNLEKSEVFKRHKKLRDLGLLERVSRLMVQYRKGIVDNKWIKHRNHTYYDLTERGRRFAEYYSKSKTSD